MPLPLPRPQEGSCWECFHLKTPCRNCQLRTSGKRVMEMFQKMAKGGRLAAPTDTNHWQHPSWHNDHNVDTSGYHLHYHQPRRWGKSWLSDLLSETIEEGRRRASQQEFYYMMYGGAPSVAYYATDYAQADVNATFNMFKALTPEPVQTNEEKPMRRRDVIISELNRLQEELARWDKFPEDTWADGKVLKIVRVFGIDWEDAIDSDSYVKYTYVAVKAEGRWHLTGGNPATPQNKKWDDIVMWLGSHCGQIIDVATGEVLFNADPENEDTEAGKLVGLSDDDEPLGANDPNLQ